MLWVVVDRRRRLPRADGPADVVRHASAESVHVDSGSPSTGCRSSTSTCWRFSAAACCSRDRRGDPAAGTATRNAAIALMLMAVNYGVRAASHHEAMARAPAVFGAQAAERCERAVRPSWAARLLAALFPTSRQRDAAADRCLVELAAMPDFISPFRWRVDRTSVQRIRTARRRPAERRRRRSDEAIVVARCQCARPTSGRQRC